MTEQNIKAADKPNRNGLTTVSFQGNANLSTIQYHNVPIGIVPVEMINKIPIDENRKYLEHSYIAGKKYKQIRLLWKISGILKLNRHLYPALIFLGIWLSKIYRSCYITRVYIKHTQYLTTEIPTYLCSSMLLFIVARNQNSPDVYQMMNG